jgi:hypothetical protein
MPPGSIQTALFVGEPVKNRETSEVKALVAFTPKIISAIQSHFWTRTKALPQWTRSCSSWTNAFPSQAKVGPSRTNVSRSRTKVGLSQTNACPSQTKVGLCLNSTSRK